MSLQTFKIRFKNTNEWIPIRSFSLSQGIKDFVAEQKGRPSNLIYCVETKVPTEDLIQRWNVFPNVEYGLMKLPLE